MGDDTLIFLYVTVRLPRGGAQGELFVLRDGENGPELLDRKRLAFCSYDVVGGGGILDDIITGLGILWEGLSNLGIDFDPTAIGIGESTFLDPTIAIDPDSEVPLIAIADNLCSIGAFKWNGIELKLVWRIEHDFEKHSSPIILPNRLMTFGRKDGRVLALNIETGEKEWEYTASEAVFATPAYRPGGVLMFIVSRNHIQALNIEDGTLINGETQTPWRHRLNSRTSASPAVN